jgi:deoxyribose-phosphate aldolase
MTNLYRIDDLTPKQIASICDHTFLATVEAYREKAEKVGGNAVEMRTKDFYDLMNFVVSSDRTPYAVCIRPEDVRHAKEFLEKHGKTNIKIASVIGFPHGPWFTTEEKLDQIRDVAKYDIAEVDPVIDYNSLKIKWEQMKVAGDVNAITKLAHRRGMLVKLILETSQLSYDNILSACRIAKLSGVDFIKTSTTLAGAGAKAEHLRIMRANFNGGVKMSGGVNEKNVYELLRAASGRTDGMIELDPLKIRIGESSLLLKL